MSARCRHLENAVVTEIRPGFARVECLECGVVWSGDPRDLVATPRWVQLAIYADAAMEACHG